MLDALLAVTEVLMKALLVIAALILAIPCANARDENPNIEAIWLPQVVNFTYQADDTFYSCSSLWRKITGILSHLGARTTAPYHGLRCDDFAQIVRMQIALESPVEATSANLRAVTDYKAEDLLVARLNGKQLPTANDLPRFPATWQTLSFRSREMQLTAGDCELVHQLRRQVLPKLSVQVVKEPTRCTASLSRGGMPRAMQVRTLLVAG
jgi:hypothetical protein